MTQNIRIKRWSKELAQLLVILVGLFAFRSSFAEPYFVPTGSMEPTIVPGDRLLVLRSAYDIKWPFSDHVVLHMHDPARGDVVVFRYPKDPSIDYIKRLIGLPGDELVIRDGVIEVNGVRLALTPAGGFVDEDLLGKHHLVQRIPHTDRLGELHIKVPEGSYFFMGDNRDNSNDSRYWGFVPKANLKGKALFVWMSLDTAHSLIPGVRWDRFGQKL